MLSRLFGIVPVALLALMVGVAGCSITTSTDDGSSDGGGGSGGGSGSTTVTGQVVDASTGFGLSGVSVSITENGALERTITASTDGSGNFTLNNVPGGAQTISASMSGYVGASADHTIPSSGSYNAGVIALSMGGATSDQWRAVLTWGEFPSDLDFHTWTPNGTEVYFGNQGPADGAELDVDDTSSFGPETITIDGSVSGTYVLYVHNFSTYLSGTGLSDSGAVVQLYNGDNLYATYAVPSGSGDNDYWEIAHVNTSSNTVTDVNAFSATEPDSVSDGGGSGSNNVTVYNTVGDEGDVYLYVDGELEYTFDMHYTVTPPTGCAEASDGATYAASVPAGYYYLEIYTDSSGFYDDTYATVYSDSCTYFTIY